MGMITFEIVEDPHKIKDYHAQWQALFDAGAYEPSVSLEWSQALVNTHLGTNRLFLLLLRNSTELLGIVPLCLRTVKKSGASLRTLFPLAEYFNTHSDLLLRHPSAELTDALLNAICSFRYRWDVFRINRFTETNPVLKLIEDRLRNSPRINYEIRRAEPSFFIRLDGGYDQYLQQRKSHFRNNLKRSLKKMYALGDVEFLGIQHFNDAADAFGVILPIEERSWKHQHGTAITSTSRQQAFYRELCCGAYAKGWLRLSILKLNGTPIAFEMGLVRGKKYYGLHNSYDESFRKENPGTVLFARFIEDLARDGIQEYDFFGEPFEWESLWTEQYRWHKSLLIYSRTARARLFSIFNCLKRRLGGAEPDQLVLRHPREITSSNEL